MSYQIQYVPEMNRRYPKRKKTTGMIGKRMMIPLILIGLIVCVGVRPIRDWLFPGDPDVTDAAAQKMVESLRSGDGIGDAVTVFCQEVLRSGTQD